ncbi:MAG: glucose-6-phosphate isomerase, partial [Chlorobium sp.]
MVLSSGVAWRALASHKDQIEKLQMRDMFLEDPSRFERFSIKWGELMLDYSKNRITPRTIDLLLDLAIEAGVEKKRGEMFDGLPINYTEGRSVLHTALRRPPGYSLKLDGLDLSSEIADVLLQMKGCCESVISGEWKGYTGKRMTDIVNIGIGGSDLGPYMVTEA